MLAGMGERLREARLRAGFASAQQLATALGMSGVTVRAHENGQNGYPAATAERYARALRVPPAWLLYGKPEDAPGDEPPPLADLPSAAAELQTARAIISRARRDLRDYLDGKATLATLRALAVTLDGYTAEGPQ
jgi:transcriptional regulator with XRE-family HTH domain